MDKIELIQKIEMASGIEYHAEDFKYVKDIIWNFYIDSEMFTEDELTLVTYLNGYNEKTLSDILYIRFGYRDLLQYLESEIQEIKSKWHNNLTENKTLTEDVAIIGALIWDGSSLEEWARNEGWNLEHLIDLLVSEDWVWQELFNIIDGQTLTKTELNDFLRFDAEDIALDLLGRD